MQNSFYLYQDMMLQMRKSSNNLLQFTPFGYMWVRLNSQKVIASHSIYSMLEKEPFSEFFTVQAWRSFVHPEDLYRLIQAEEELLYTGLPSVAEIPFNYTIGTPHFCRSSHVLDRLFFRAKDHEHYPGCNGAEKCGDHRGCNE